MKKLSVVVAWVLWAFTCFAQVTTGSAPLAPSGQGQSGQPNPGGQDSNKQKADSRHNRGATADCTPTKKLPPFSMDASGNVSAKGRSVEGPVCIEVQYNPLQFRVSFSSVETRTAGPDPSTILLGNATAARGVGTASAELAPKGLSNAFGQLKKTYDGLSPRVNQEQTSYGDAVAAQSKTTADIKSLLNSITGMSLEQQAKAIGGNYKEKIYPDIQDAHERVNSLAPSDQSTKAASGKSLLQQLRELSDNLDQLGYTYTNGDKLPDKTVINCTGDTKSPDGATVLNAGWRDWYVDAACKQLYDSLKKSVQDAIASMQPYTANSDNMNTLRAKAAIVNYWEMLFLEIGASPDSDELDLQKYGIRRDQESCGNIFNQNSSRAISLVTVDESPTLEGKDPTVKTQDAFLTVTCASPIFITAGAVFSSIEQEEFAIVKSAGATPAGPSVAKFGTLSDSRFRPMPMAFVHAKVGDSNGQKVGYHVTLGVGGNIQGQDAGGSSAEFLTGMSVSFWRVVYLSAGLHIGTKAELAGGFHENDLVPSDISTMQGQVKRSYTAGFGFALSFRKP